MNICLGQDQQCKKYLWLSQITVFSEAKVSLVPIVKQLALLYDRHYE